jgi:hypothetical protein
VVDIFCGLIKDDFFTEAFCGSSGAAVISCIGDFIRHNIVVCSICEVVDFARLFQTGLRCADQNGQLSLE